MDQENKPVNEPHLPPGVEEDAQQFRQWMTQYGRPALIGLAIAVVVMLGISIWRGQQEEKKAAAVQALFQARSPEEFQQMANLNPEAPTAPMALASAASEFYAQDRYDEALTSYREFMTRYPGHMLAPDAALGVAASLEALEEYEAAAESYEAFAQAHPDNALLAQAVMGAARCREQLGQFDEARALYEDFLVAHPDSSWVAQAESGLLFLKKAERAKDLPPREIPAVAGPAGHEVVSEPIFVTEDEFLTMMGDEAEGAETVEETVVEEESPDVEPEAVEETGTVEAETPEAPEANEADAGEPAPE